MIVRQRKFTVPKHILFNAAVCLVLAVGTAAAIRGSMYTEQVPLCDQRYQQGTLFSLARSNGEPLSPEDLQSRLGGLDWGLTSNTRIVPDKGVAYGYALEIDLKPVAASQSSADVAPSGAGFSWLPRMLPDVKAACLSYSVWTPANFKPGDGGVLPGLSSEATVADYGAPRPTGDSQSPSAFQVRAQWRADGSIGSQRVPAGNTRSVSSADGKAMLQPGRWTKIEQEAVLNTPGRSNGVLRLWVDGQLQIDRSDMDYRSDSSQSFLAVTGDTYFTRRGTRIAPAADTRIRLSPLELRYN